MVYNAGMPPKYYGAAAQYNKPAPGLMPGAGGMGGKKILMIVGLILFVILVLVGGLTLISGLTKGPQDDFVALTARTSNLTALLEKQKPNIKNGDLKKINAEATTLILSDSMELTNQATTLFGVAEIPEAIAAAQSFATVEEELEAAKVSGTFDRTYVTQVTDLINGTFDLAQKMHGAVSTKEAQDVLDKAMTNLITINDQLSKVQL
jgi:hypothetical protein